VVVVKVAADDDGAGTILMLGIAAVICSMALAVALLGTALTARGRAQTAADLGALAAAQALIDGFEQAAACQAAATIITANRAIMTSCVSDTSTTIKIETEAELPGPGRSGLGQLRAHAQARAGPPSAR
jgi:secretion/DNA translocation related TadE-like protein